MIVNEYDNISASSYPYCMWIPVNTDIREHLRTAKEIMQIQGEIEDDDFLEIRQSEDGRLHAIAYSSADRLYYDKYLGEDNILDF